MEHVLAMHKALSLTSETPKERKQFFVVAAVILGVTSDWK